MKAIEKAQAIYSNGLHKLIIDLIEELEERENRSCENCKYLHQNYLCLELGCGNVHPKEIGLKCCNKWEAKNENL